MEIVVARDVIKEYGYKETKFRALEDINITVSEGEYIVIMGSSGAGKSTLLNLLSTVDMPSGGIVEVNGTNVYMMSGHQLKEFRGEQLGFIFQNCNLLDKYTIRENIAYPLIRKNENKEVINKKVLEVARKLDIEKILDKLPQHCSGGEKQRAAAARALVIEPKILIADEPTGNLDSENSRKFLELVEKLRREVGLTMIMVTHSAEIASYSQKVVYLNDGRIVEIFERGDLTREAYLAKIESLELGGNK